MYSRQQIECCIRWRDPRALPARRVRRRTKFATCKSLTLHDKVNNEDTHANIYLSDYHSIVHIENMSRRNIGDYIEAPQVYFLETWGLLWLSQSWSSLVLRRSCLFRFRRSVRLTCRRSNLSRSAGPVPLECQRAVIRVDYIDGGSSECYFAFIRSITLSKASSGRTWCQIPPAVTGSSTRCLYSSIWKYHPLVVYRLKHDLCPHTLKNARFQDSVWCKCKLNLNRQQRLLVHQFKKSQQHLR